MTYSFELTLDWDPRTSPIEALAWLWGLPVVEVSLIIDHHIVRGEN